jgi:F-type H+-transporting ATPase subunit delta
MKELIAKKYVNALLTDLDSDVANKYYEQLKSLASAFSSDKLIAIISTPDVDKSKRTELFLSFIENCDDKMTNFIKLLGENSGFEIIPEIVEQMKNELNKINNNYEGTIFVKEELDKSVVSDLEEKFGKKFNTTLKLTQNVCDYDGIKVDIDGLGVEVSFSADRLKANLSEYILKAI